MAVTAACSAPWCLLSWSAQGLPRQKGFDWYRAGYPTGAQLLLKTCPPPSRPGLVLAQAGRARSILVRDLPNASTALHLSYLDVTGRRTPKKPPKMRLALLLVASALVAGKKTRREKKKPRKSKERRHKHNMRRDRRNKESK